MSKRWLGSSVGSVASVVLVAAVLSCTGASAAPTSASAGIPALNAVVDQPEDVAFDASGNLYVSEFAGHEVDRIDTNGMLTVFAGTAVEGYSGDGGPATDAMLNMPTGLLFRPNGDLVIADHRNDCIREVDSAGIINTIAGTCTKRGTKGDGGPATKARLNDPIGITLDAAGNLYVADEQNALVRVIDPSGQITTFAGGGRIDGATAPNGAPATSLKLSHTSYVVADTQGDVYFSDFLLNELFRVDPNGRITHIAGTGAEGFSGDGGPATKAELDFPTGLALDSHGRLYFSDAFNNRVRMINARGVISTVAGSGPVGLSTGSYGGDGGAATDAHLNAPAGLVFDSAGDLYIADQGNECLRRVDPSGRITLVAGMP